MRYDNRFYIGKVILFTLVSIAKTGLGDPAINGAATNGLANAMAANSAQQAQELQKQSDESQDPGEKSKLGMMALAQMAQAMAGMAAAMGNKKSKDSAQANPQVQQPTLNTSMPPDTSSKDDPKASLPPEAATAAQDLPPVPEVTPFVPETFQPVAATETPQPSSQITVEQKGEAPVDAGYKVPDRIRGKLGYDETNPVNPESGSGMSGGPNGGAGGGASLVRASGAAGAAGGAASDASGGKNGAKRLANGSNNEGVGASDGGTGSGSGGHDEEKPLPPGGPMDFSSMLTALVGGGDAPATSGAMPGDGITTSTTSKVPFNARENIFEHANGWYRKLNADDRAGKRRGTKLGMSLN